MMKKWSKILMTYLLMVCIPFCGMAETEWNMLETPEFLKQYSVEELLLLREMIDEELASREEQSISAVIYVLNTNTAKFHLPSCASAGKIKEQNKKEYTGSREELIAVGYSPCGNCHP